MADAEWQITPRAARIGSERDLFLSCPDRGLKVDETAFDLGASRLDFFSGKKIVQRVFQISMAGVLLLRSVSESIINGASIKQGPGLGFDAEGFRRSRRAHGTSYGLVVIQ